MMKRPFMILLSAALYLSLFSLAFTSKASAETVSGTWGNLHWSLSSTQSGTLTVSGTGDMPDFNQDWTVAWRSYKRNIGSIRINSGVTGIGDYAFHGCINLKDVYIADTVKTIGNAAFGGCGQVKQISLPKDVREINSEAFLGWWSLTELILPDGVVSIGSKAFYDCHNLAAVTIPDSVESIGEGAFSLCSNLSEIHYHGSRAQWAQISVEKDNETLTEALFRYEPALTATDGDTHTLYSADGLSFLFPDTIDTVFIGGQQLTGPDDFSLSADGKTVTLSATFLDQLRPGNSYTVTVYNAAGDAGRAAFHIADCPLLVPGTPLAAGTGEPLRFVAPQDGYFNFGYENGSTKYELQLYDRQTGSWRNDPSTQGRRFSKDETVYLRPQYNEAAEGRLRVLAWQVTAPAQDSVEAGPAYRVTNSGMTLDFTLNVTENTADSGYAVGLLVSWSGPDFGAGPNTSRYSYNRAYAARNNETLTLTLGGFVPGQSFYYRAILIDMQNGSILAQGSSIHHVQFDDDLTGFEPLALNTPCSMTGRGQVCFYFEAPADGMYAVEAGGVSSMNVKDNRGYQVLGSFDQSGWLFGTPVKAGERLYITTAQNTGQSGSVGVYEGLLKLPEVTVGTQSVEEKDVGRFIPLRFTAPETGDYSFTTNSSAYMRVIDEIGNTLYFRGIYWRMPLLQGQVVWIDRMERAPGVTLTIVHETIPLRQLVFPSELTQLDDEACRGLPIDDVVLGDRIQTIGSKAFADCPHLKRVEIPIADVVIAEDAFDNSSSVILYAPIGGSVEQYAAEHHIMLEAMLP